MSKSSFIPKPIDQQTIVITGASSGIGLATAKLAAQKGARVVLSSRNGEELNNCVDYINREGGNSIAIVADVSKWDDLVNLKNEAIKAFGSIDTWINNAGTSIYGYLMDTDFSEERKLFETNFWGARMGCAVALEAMKEKGGVIINLGSEVSVASQPLVGIYSASKHALKAFTESFRSELRDRNIPIAVSLIRPTAINTPFAEHGANRLPEGEPSLPSPMYPPELAAEAIVKCCENPQRDVYVGGPAKLSAILDTFFPSLKDLVAETRMKEMKKGTKNGHLAMNENLHHPPSEEGKEEGNNPGMKTMSSIYTEATTLGFVRSIAHTARMSFKLKKKAS